MHQNESFFAEKRSALTKNLEKFAASKNDKELLPRFAKKLLKISNFLKRWGGGLIGKDLNRSSLEMETQTGKKHQTLGERGNDFQYGAQRSVPKEVTLD